MFKHLGIQLKLHQHSNEQKDVAKPSKGERKFKREMEEKRGSECKMLPAHLLSLSHMSSEANLQKYRSNTKT